MFGHNRFMEQEHTKLGQLFKSTIQLPSITESFDSAIPIWEMLGISLEEYNERYPSIVVTPDSEPDDEPEVEAEPTVEAEPEPEPEAVPEPEKEVKKVKRSYVRRKKPETK
jgi:hypothetical protein